MNVNHGRGASAKISSIQKVFWGFAWNHLSKITQYTLLFLTSIVVARYLGPKEYSIYVSITNIGSIIFILSFLGIESAINTYVPQFLSHKGRISYLLRMLLGARFVSLFVFCSLLYFGAPFLSRFLYQDGSDISLPLRISIGHIVFYSFSHLLETLFIALLQTKIIAAASIISLSLRFGLSYFFLTMGYGVNSVLLVLGFSSLLSCLLYVLKAFPYLTAPSQTIQLRPIFRYSLTLGLITSIDFVLGKQTDILLIGYLGHVAEDVGYYHIALGLVEALEFLLIGGLRGVNLSFFSEVWSQKGEQGLRTLWKLNMQLEIMVKTPALLFLAYHSHVIITTFYSDLYMPGIKLLQIWAVLTICYRIAGLEVHPLVLYVMNKEHAAFRARLSGGIINLILDILLIPSLGAMGAIIATGISGVLIGIFQYFAMRRYLRCTYPFKFIIKLFVIAGMPFIVLTAVPGSNILWGLINGILYLGLLIVLFVLIKPLNRQDILPLQSANHRFYKMAQYVAR